jgi:hypothetical protein
MSSAILEMKPYYIQKKKVVNTPKVVFLVVFKKRKNVQLKLYNLNLVVPIVKTQYGVGFPDPPSTFATIQRGQETFRAKVIRVPSCFTVSSRLKLDGGFRGLFDG